MGRGPDSGHALRPKCTFLDLTRKIEAKQMKLGAQHHCEISRRSLTSPVLLSTSARDCRAFHAGGGDGRLGEEQLVPFLSFAFCSHTL